MTSFLYFQAEIYITQPLLEPVNANLDFYQIETLKYTRLKHSIVVGGEHCGGKTRGLQTVFNLLKGFGMSIFSTLPHGEYTHFAPV